ncbi:hypothetical protein ACWATR_35410 [Nostoc sp. UIC 10890]
MSNTDVFIKCPKCGFSSDYDVPSNETIVSHKILNAEKRLIQCKNPKGCSEALVIWVEREPDDYYYDPPQAPWVEREPGDYDYDPPQAPR